MGVVFAPVGSPLSQARCPQGPFQGKSPGMLFSGPHGDRKPTRRSGCGWGRAEHAALTSFHRRRSGARRVLARPRWRPRWPTRWPS